MENQSLFFRVLGRQHDGRYQAICLETNIAVVADSESDMRKKMEDALLLYLNSFTVEEIKEGKFQRNARLRYRLMWTVNAVRWNVHHNIQSMRASGDMQHLRIA